MKSGNLVKSKIDIANGFDVLGIITELRINTDDLGNQKTECFVLWSSISQPTGWWWADLLEVVDDKAA